MVRRLAVALHQRRATCSGNSTCIYQFSKLLKLCRVEFEIEKDRTMTSLHVRPCNLFLPHYWWVKSLGWCPLGELEHQCRTRRCELVPGVLASSVSKFRAPGVGSQTFKSTHCSRRYSSSNPSFTALPVRPNIRKSLEKLHSNPP